MTLPGNRSTYKIRLVVATSLQDGARTIGVGEAFPCGGSYMSIDLNINEDNDAEAPKDGDRGLLVLLTKKEEPLVLAAASKASKGRHHKREGYGIFPCSSVGRW